MATLSEEYVWWIDKRGKLGVGKWSYADGEITAFDSDDVSGSKVIRVYILTRAAALAAATLTGKPNIPGQFHEVLVARVLNRLCARAATRLANKGEGEAAMAMVKMAQHWYGEWKSGLKKGTIHANIGKDFTTISTQADEY